MEPKSLQELAAFAAARQVWSSYINCSADTIFLQLDRNSPSFSWKNLSEVENFFQKLYPGLPNSLNNTILFAASLIDKELTRWKSNLRDIVGRFDDICWTAYFTIDRIRSQCLTKNFSLEDEFLCECCTTHYVDEYRTNFTPHENRKIRRIFGSFVEHAILCWYWYGRYNRSFLSHVWKYYRYYREGSPIENVFKLAVYCEYETGVFHYWSKMTSDQQQNYHLTIVPLILAESDNLEFIEFNGLLPFHTFSFFWFRLNDYERFDVVQYYFVDFYRYMLYHEGGLEWVYAFLGSWSPSIAPMEYYKVLRLSIDTNNLDLFECLWKRKLAMLPFEAVGHLMWTLLFQKDVDFKLSVMIINEYDNERKVEVLNELDKRIECVKFNFLEKIEKFLDAASLQHLRVNGFPRNPRTRHSRNRRSCRR